IGPQGDTGLNGAQGFQGRQGLQGTIGPQGSTGSTGSQGSTGAQGAVGPQGNDGAQGPQGSVDGTLPVNATVHNIYTEAVIPDTTPITPSIILDGSSVSAISVPSGQSLVITDLYIGIGFLYWTIEVDRGLGGGFVPLAIFGFTLLDVA